MWAASSLTFFSLYEKFDKLPAPTHLNRIKG